MSDEFESCTNCIHSADTESLCILRLCKHAIAETKECYEPKAQPAIEPKRGRWILCSERMPSVRQSVILSTKEWTGEGCYWETTEHHVIWKGYRWNATYWDDEVIAWMPLPKPWKEGEEG